MNSPVRSMQLPKRQKFHIRSLTSLLDKERVPLPQQSFQFKIFNEQYEKKQKIKSMLHSRQPITHKRAMSQQQLMRKTGENLQEVKFGVLGSLRRTWHPSTFQNELKLRTAGAFHQKRQKQLISNKTGLNNNRKPISLASLDLERREKYKIINQNNAKQTQQSQKTKFLPHCQQKSHKFLRKGASINRQVVANIIKLRLGKKIQENNPKSENQQIVRMIRLYKGYGQVAQKIVKAQKNIQTVTDNCENRQQYQQSQQEERRTPLRNKNILQRSINGWRQKSEQAELIANGYHNREQEDIMNNF